MDHTVRSSIQPVIADVKVAIQHFEAKLSKDDFETYSDLKALAQKYKLVKIKLIDKYL